MNYTRNFTNGESNIYLRAGGGAAFEVQLDKVTSDPSRANQTTEAIGSFKSGGIRSGFNWVALTDDSGRRAVVDLNGKTTLRASILAGSPSLNFFMITPAVEEDVPAEPVSTTLLVRTEGNQLIINWESGGNLQSTSDLSSDQWNAVKGASSPYTSEVSGAQMFYRVR